MKFIIRQILIALALIAIICESKCEREVRKYRLSRVFENIIENRNREYEDEIEKEIRRALDMDCVKNFFKLPQNNKMIVQEIEEVIFMFVSIVKCSDEDKAFQTIYREYIREDMKRHLTCLKWHLKQLEPTSKLIENFEINETEIKECQKKFPIYAEFANFRKSLEYMVGPLNVYTCGAVSEDGANDFLAFVSKGVVIEFGDISEELKKSEKEKLKQYFKDIAIGTVNCVIKRFEDDPQANTINSTLNYYYQKELVPIDPEQYDPNDYYKRLIKLEGTIDFDCVKKKLNLQENGNKSLLKVEATILIASAKSKCIKVDPLEFADLFIDFGLDNGHRYDRYMSCAKYKLQKLEPTSKLAITSSSDEPHEKFCRHHSISLYPFSIPSGEYNESVGRLNEATCEVLTDEIVDVITLKTILLYNVKDKDLKINETRELFDEVIVKLHKLADCIIERAK